MHPPALHGARRGRFSVARGTLSDAHLRLLEGAYPAYYWRPLSDVYDVLSELCGAPDVSQEEEAFVSTRASSVVAPPLASPSVWMAG